MRTLDEIKVEIWEANKSLVSAGLVKMTWGNVSGYDRMHNLVVIKPSGLNYEEMTPEDMVVMSLSGEKISGELNPSSDTPTHLEIYRAFPMIGGITHTHSMFATSFAQANISIDCYGTTHADHFYGAVPITRWLTKEEVDSYYEKNTGKLIAETFQGKNPLEVPAVLVAGHGPFTFGKTPKESVYNAIALEEIAMQAYYSKQLNANINPLKNYIIDKHYLRKHGPNAYYGQLNPEEQEE